MTALWRKLPKMSHEEWLAWRRTGIGGSDAPAVMDVSPWCTRFQKYEEKVFGKKDEDNASKAFGRAGEEGARREVEALFNKEFFTANVERIDNPWIKASLDGLDLDCTTVIEIKKANKEDHALAKKGQVPTKYYPQLQHIVQTLGFAGIVYFSSPADGSKGIALEIPRDDAYIEKELFPNEREFWNMVVNQEPPELTDRDFVSLDDNKEWQIAAKKWQETNKLLKCMKKKDDLLREQLKALANGKNVFGSGIKLSKALCKGAVDYKAAIQDYMDNLRALYPEVKFPPLILEPYRKSPFLKWTPSDMSKE